MGRVRLMDDAKVSPKRFPMQHVGASYDLESDAQPLTYDALLQPFEEACKPPEQWCIGVESERFGVDAVNGAPVHYEGPRGVVEIFEILVNRFGWSPQSEVPGGPVILLNRGRTSITLEPGGQLELSGAPHPDIHRVHNETREHLSEMGRVSDNLGLAWMGIGFQPLAHQDDLDWVPKLRYGIMREYLATRGNHALDMMRRAATVQVNFDYSDPLDAIRKMRVALRLSPVVSAMCANAPFVEARLFGGRSYRMRVWFDVDPDRQGLLARMWDERTTLRDYIDWALDVPMFCIKRGSGVVRNTGQAFRSFMQDGYHGNHATLSDWTTHLNTLFPEVRIKRTLEMRGADSLPFEIMCALPALWTGLIYDEMSLAAAEALTARWTPEQMDDVRATAAIMGLQTPFHGRPLAHVAERVFQIARDGLIRRGRVDPDTGLDETTHLDALARFVEHGLTPADKLADGLQGRTQLRNEILRRVRP